MSAVKVFVSGQARWGGQGWGAWAVGYPTGAKYGLASQRIHVKPVGDPSKLEMTAVIHALREMTPSADVVVVTLNPTLAQVLDQPNRELADALDLHGSVKVEHVNRQEMPEALAIVRSKAMEAAEIDAKHLQRLRKRQSRRPKGDKSREPVGCNQH